MVIDSSRRRKRARSGAEIIPCHDGIGGMCTISMAPQSLLIICLNYFIYLQTHLYLFGGCPVSGRLNDFWSFNPLTCVWTQLASPDVGPRGGPGVTYTDGKIWLFGGFDGLSCEPLSYIPLPKTFQELISLNNRFYPIISYQARNLTIFASTTSPPTFGLPRPS